MYTTENNTMNSLLSEVKICRIPRPKYCCSKPGTKGYPTEPPKDYFDIDDIQIEDLKIDGVNLAELSRLGQVPTKSSPLNNNSSSNISNNNNNNNILVEDKIPVKNS